MQSAVWIVENDEAIREAMTMLLRRRGVRVFAHSSMTDLLKVPNLDGCACLLLDDQNAELSGMELLEVLRSRRVGTPAVIMASQTSPQFAHRAARAGATVLHKPVSAGELLSALRTAAPAVHLA